MNKNKVFEKKILFAAWACHNKCWSVYQKWDGPLRKMFKNVVTFDPQENLYLYGREAMNKNLLEVVDREKPDYIFFQIVQHEFFFTTLAKIKEISPKTKIVNFTGDDDVDFEPLTIQLFPFVDYFFVAHTEFIPKYPKKAFFLCGANIDEFRPLNLDKAYDVSFVGSPKADRDEILQYLIENGVNVKIFGGGWHSYTKLAKNYCGQIDNKDFIKIINQTKINLCLSKNYGGTYRIPERFFEVNACKSFMLTEHPTSFWNYREKFIEGKDIVSFTTNEELVKKIKYYLSKDKERERIAYDAYKKTVKYYSMENLLLEGFEEIIKDEKKHILKNNFGVLDSIYLNKEDIWKDDGEIKKILNDFKYVCFKDPAYEPLPFKEFLQKNSLIMTKKDISVCSALLNSSLIGDYGALNCYGIRRYFDDEMVNKNIDLSQLMVKKDYFLKNLELFRDFSLSKTVPLLNLKNTSFISFPLVRTKNKVKMSSDSDGRFFLSYFESDLLALRNSKKLLKSKYLYKLIIYCIFCHNYVLNHLLRFTLKRTKNPFFMKAAFFIEKIFRKDNKKLI